MWIWTRIIWEVGLWSNMRFLQLSWVNRYINSSYVYIHCIRRDTRHVHHFNSRIPISCHLIIFYNNSFILDFFHFDNHENLEMGNCYCPRIKIILKEKIIPSSSSLGIWGHLHVCVLIVFPDLGIPGWDWPYKEWSWPVSRNGTVSIWHKLCDIRNVTYGMWHTTTPSWTDKTLTQWKQKLFGYLCKFRWLIDGHFGNSHFDHRKVILEVNTRSCWSKITVILFIPQKSNVGIFLIRKYSIFIIFSDSEFRMLNELQDQLNKAKMDHELLKIKVQSLYTLMAAEGPQDLKANEMLDYIAKVCWVINMSHSMALKI